MIIIVCYYYLIYKYIIDYNSEVVTTSTITMEKLKVTEVPNIWYKSILDNIKSDHINSLVS